MLRVKSKKFNAVFLWPSMSLNILLFMKRLEVQKNKNILLIVFILYQYYNKDDFDCQVDNAAPFLIMKIDSGTLWNSNVSLEPCTRQAFAFLVLFLCCFFVVIFCIFEGFRIKSLLWTKCNQLTSVTVFLISTLHNLSILSFPLGKYLFKVNDEDTRTLFS